VFNVRCDSSAGVNGVFFGLSLQRKGLIACDCDRQKSSSRSDMTEEVRQRDLARALRVLYNTEWYVYLAWYQTTTTNVSPQEKKEAGRGQTSIAIRTLFSTSHVVIRLSLLLDFR
jgi:hypothetical protein